MLNISLERITGRIDTDQYKAFNLLKTKNVSDVLIRILLGMLLIIVISLFLPWTQNVRAKGYVTTLSPDDRPSTIQALIGGRIDKWYVKEGAHVRRGDTIIKISEVKEEYLDPQLLARTNSQIEAKVGSANAYEEKAQNLQQQLKALQNSKAIKLEQNTIKVQQTMLKIQSDSIELVAAQTKQEIALNQLKRMEELNREGLKSLTDLEAKRLSVQNANAKVIALENKINTHQNELLNLTANITAIENEYDDKIAKSRSERMSAMSSKFDADATRNKLQSQYNAYEVRQQNYYITSPIDGIVTEALKYGIGEIIKNGEEVVSIIPKEYQLAIRMYVEPRDMPLFKIGQQVRTQFDGWPAIVFSGWPNSSYGTFGGHVFAIDNFISDNGKYRILVAPDPTDIPWPEEVRVGGGANTITLLNDVRVGYELWRQLNGFPADYYKPSELTDTKSKAPLKKVK